MGRPGKYRWFREDLCRSCGECLAACPVVALPREAARRDRRTAREGAHGDSLSLALCTTCNVCDLVCPAGANPYELVLERFDAAEKEKGLPGLARTVFPNEYLNIWTILRPLLDERERRNLGEWEENLRGTHRAVLLTGFYTNIVPFLLDDPLIRGGMTVAGSETLWGCGGDSNKLGLIAVTEAAAALVKNRLASMKVKRIVCFMEAEAAMLGEILPRRYGTRLAVKITSLDEWLLDRMKKGDITVSSPLDMKVAVHDNCMSRYLEGKPQETMREIASRCGCGLVEMEHNRDRALCCGWAATIPALHGGASPPGTLLYMLHSLDRRLREAVATGADAVVTGCPACYLFLSLAKYLTKRKIDVRHTTELVAMAAGGTAGRKIDDRVLDILAVTVFFMTQWVRSGTVRAPFHPAPPDTKRIAPLPVLAEKDGRSVVRIRRFLGGRVVSGRIARWLIAGTVRSAARLYGAYLAMKRKRFIRSAS